MEYNGWTAEKLIEFENDIIELYEKRLIKPSPVHLAGGNEEQLIKIFSDYSINKNDWVLSTWRSHYHWLLTGRDPNELKKQIIDGHSMHIYDDKFFSSAIVGGISPIAVGLAYAIKLKGETGRVFCFLGCAGSRCGISLESINYSEGHDLPITFIVEDNDKCVRAKTSLIWGETYNEKLEYYNYHRVYQHAGISKEGEIRKYVMF